MPVSVGKKNFTREVSNSDLPVLVKFWVRWCSPCRKFTPDLEYIEKKYKGKIKVCKIDVDYSPDIASSQGIKSVPFLAVFDKGKMVRKKIGTFARHELIEFVKPYVNSVISRSAFPGSRFSGSKGEKR